MLELKKPTGLLPPMTDDQKFGPQDVRADRWERTVNVLDHEFGTSWRRSAGHYLGDDVGHTIRALAYRYFGLPAASLHDKIRKLEDELGGLRVELLQTRAERDDARNRATVSAQFRRKEDKHWDMSYTKRVVDAVKNQLGYRALTANKPDSRVLKDINAALELLEDYHTTQHQVYERAEAAEKNVEIGLKRAAELQESLNTMTKAYTELVDSYHALKRAGLSDRYTGRLAEHSIQSIGSAAAAQATQCEAPAATNACRQFENLSIRGDVHPTPLDAASNAGDELESTMGSLFPMLPLVKRRQLRNSIARYVAARMEAEAHGAKYKKL